MRPINTSEKLYYQQIRQKNYIINKYVRKTILSTNTSEKLYYQQIRQKNYIINKYVRKTILSTNTSEKLYYQQIRQKNYIINKYILYITTFHLVLSYSDLYKNNTKTNIQLVVTLSTYAMKKAYKVRIMVDH